MRWFDRSTLLALVALASCAACGASHSTPPTVRPSVAGCWPTDLAADGTTQRVPVAVAGAQLGPADATPSPPITALAARQQAGFTQTGATAQRTVLATVIRPGSGHPRAWVTVGCHVPYASKVPSPGRSGFATVVTPVDATSGVVLFSLTQGEGR